MRLFLILPFVLALLFSNCSKLQNDYVANANSKCQACHLVPPADAMHATHVGNRDYDCSFCHPDAKRNSAGTPEVTGALHANGDTNVSFTASTFPLSAGVFNSASKTCESVYCHGYFRGGDSAVMHFSDTISISRCEGCHNINLMTTRGHSPHTRDNVMDSTTLSEIITSCDNCHVGYSFLNRQVNAATHINGTAEPVSDTRCQECHGLPHDSTLQRTECTRCHVR